MTKLNIVFAPYLCLQDAFYRFLWIAAQELYGGENGHSFDLIARPSKAHVELSSHIYFTPCMYITNCFLFSCSLGSKFIRASVCASCVMSFMQTFPNNMFLFCQMCGYKRKMISQDVPSAKVLFDLEAMDNRLEQLKKYLP